MSEYHKCSISLTDTKCLVDALVEMGYQPKICEEAENLYGYQGDKRVQKAHVILPRSQVGNASNDIGFEKVGKDYIMHISQYDESVKSLDTNKLKQLYAKHKINKFIKKNSGKYRIKNQQVDKNGSIKIRINRIS